MPCSRLLTWPFFNTQTCITPPWVGIHDGSFDTYNGNEAIPAPFEALAEDGNNGPAMEAFAAAPGGVWDATAGGGPLCPGDSATIEFMFVPVSGATHYFSYAAMIIPR